MEARPDRADLRHSISRAEGANHQPLVVAESAAAARSVNAPLRRCRAQSLHARQMDALVRVRTFRPRGGFHAPGRRRPARKERSAAAAQANERNHGCRYWWPARAMKTARGPVSPRPWEKEGNQGLAARTPEGATASIACGGSTPGRSCPKCRRGSLAPRRRKCASSPRVQKPGDQGRIGLSRYRVDRPSSPNGGATWR
jgi:hypothetical protein